MTLLLGLIVVAALAACGGDDDDGDTAGNPPAAGAYGGGGAETEGAATSGSEKPPKPGGEARRAETVEMVDFAFEPSRVTVQVGGKVTWKNQGEAPHTATADDESFDTGTVDAGKLKAETFKQAGSYSYICTIHPQMKATVEVVEP